MPELRSPVKVTAAPQGDATVTIYQADGSTARVAYTTATGATTHSFPVTVTAGTTTSFYVQSDQICTVSIKYGTVEVANGYAATWLGTVSNDGVAFAPTYPLGAAAAGSNGSNGDWSTAQTINAQTGTTYTLVAGDAGKLVTLSNASAITLTLPQDSDATFANGVYVDLAQLGAGQVTVAAGTGATLRVSGLTAKARAQYSRLGVQKIAANTWHLFGDLAGS